MTTTPAAASPMVSKGISIFQKNGADWEDLRASSGEKSEQDRAKAAKRDLHDLLLASLQMQHLMVLAGSGTSLGDVGGPSMWVLWDHCVNNNPATGDAERKKTDLANEIIANVAYDEGTYGENIEALLSQCEAFLQYKPGDADVVKFLNEAKKTILKKCSEFLDSKNATQLDAHGTFLHRLSRRRVRDSRLKLFTTNYDLCFEFAASKQGLVAVDGFSFSQPRYFDPRFFQYDIVRRTPATGESGSPLEGVFQLFKLHGSVNWAKRENDAVEMKTDPKPAEACLIYPAKGKYQQSYVLPHLELISQYFSSLREPNTCVLVVGFGFNDDHLSEPILAAVRTNPYLRLIVVSDKAQENAKNGNRYWKGLFERARNGADILLVNGTFKQFADEIPNLKSLSPAEQLAKNITALAGGH